jgi:hypothetical protein
MTKANMLGQYVFRIVISLYERKLRKKLKNLFKRTMKKMQIRLGVNGSFLF